MHIHVETTMSRRLTERCSIALKNSVEAMQQDIQGELSVMNRMIITKSIFELHVKARSYSFGSL